MHDHPDTTYAIVTAQQADHLDRATHNQLAAMVSRRRRAVRWWPRRRTDPTQSESHTENSHVGTSAILVR